jgi:mannose-6-phosphate isomerase class I
VVSYDRFPVTPVGAAADVAVGWDAIAAEIGRGDPNRVVVEAYPGVRPADLAQLARRLDAAFVDTTRFGADVEALVAADLTDDPVFGRLSKMELAQFVDVAALRRAVAELEQERVVIGGPGASLAVPPEHADVVVYADLPRWEIQQRQRAGEVGSLAASPPNAGARPWDLYKRAYFVDWRAADRHKRRVWPDVAYVLDTTQAASPKLVAAPTFFAALDRVARRPFRVVPFFDPAPWGGTWMRDTFGLDPDEPRFGWCFDCVPEENSLLLGFGPTAVEVPAIDVVFAQPKALLGEAVQARFGDEFPIRFDLLDTMGGGNLSLQVHPLTQYIAEHFGVHYTQDESYYLLAASGQASVFLGLKTGVDAEAFAADLRRAERGERPFPAADYVNQWPAARHDHFLIPAGTVHCSGAGGVVLEISATPYIFTFKLWDWDRLGLDGLPRPVSVDHGLANVQWERQTDWVRRNLVNRVTPIAHGPHWREERTGLHEAEFIETRRHWFDGPVRHDRAAGQGVCVLNLVQGEAAVVTSPDDAFDPLEVHFAETFIVPAAAGPFVVTPLGDQADQVEHATIKAFVR